MLSLALAALAGCPQTEAIEHKLSALRTRGAPVPSYRLELTRAEGSVTLTARAETGETWLTRALPSTAPCEELEDAAAVVLLAWEAQLAPGAVPVPEIEQRAPGRPPTAASTVTVHASASAQLWLSAAAATWGAAGSIALRRGAWGGALEVLGQGRRTVTLGNGAATWSRVSVALGPCLAVKLTPLVDLSATVSAVTGAFFAGGRGFDVNTPVTDWDLGLSAGIQLQLPGLWRVRPFVGVSGLMWLRRHALRLSSGPASPTVGLPWLEAAPVLGLSVTP